MATIVKAPQSAGPQTVVTRPVAPSSHAPASNGCSSPTAQQAAGNLAVQRLFRSGAIQAKLAISQPGDPDELEADQIADQVMRMPEPGSAVPCAACAAGDQPCPKCSGTPKIQRTARDSSGGMAVVTENPLRHLGSGQPLDRSTRSFFEPRFGTALSHVRVHTDSSAAESARVIQARAFTTGRDVVFGAGQFAPESGEGKRLLAHELAHVVQQNNGSDTLDRIQRQDVSDLSVTSVPATLATKRKFPTTGETATFFGIELSESPDQLREEMVRLVITGVPNRFISPGIYAPFSFMMMLKLSTLLTRSKESVAPDASSFEERHRREVLETKILPKLFEVVAELYKCNRKTIDDFSEQTINAVSEVLDMSEKQVFKEATRYGISPDPTGNKVPSSSPFLDVPPKRPERQALKKAAQDILAAWRKKDQDKQLAQALLSPLKFIEIEKQFDIQRKESIQQFPILAAYVKDREKLQRLVAEKDPAANIEREINLKLDNIAYIRAEKETHRDQFKLDRRFRNAAKNSMLIPSNSVEAFIIDQHVLEIKEDAEFTGRLKSAAGFGVLILSFVPGFQLIAVPGGLLLMGADILGKLEDFRWEEAASGTAFDRAIAISQSDPSLFKLGVEIAVGLGQGAVEYEAIARAVKIFKVLAPVVREAVAARMAARTAETALATQAAAKATARVEASARVQAADGEQLGKRLKNMIERDEYLKDEGAILEAAQSQKRSPAQLNATGAGKLISNLPDALGGKSHSIRITPKGNIRCSSPFCMELADSIVYRLRQIGIEKLTEGQLQKGRSLAERARKAKAEARSIVEGSAAEETLATEIKKIETEMVSLEREPGKLSRDKLDLRARESGFEDFDQLALQKYDLETTGLNLHELSGVRELVGRSARKAVDQLRGKTGTMQEIANLAIPNRAGTRAHSIFEKSSYQINELLADIGSPIHVAPEVFRFSGGNLAPRRAYLSIGIDVVIFDGSKNTTVSIGVDLKTTTIPRELNELMAPERIAEFIKRFGFLRVEIVAVQQALFGR